MAEPLRRTELTCPGHSLAMMTKAAATTADEVIFDLEDGCAPNQKEAARIPVVNALLTLDFGRKLRAVRVNGTKTPHCYRDVIEVVEGARGKLDALVVPKVEGPGDVAFVDCLLTQIEIANGLPRGRIGLEVLMESARGLLAANEIAGASPRLQSLIFGIADFAGELGAPDFDDDSSVRFHHAKSVILTAARAHGLAAIDHVTVQYKDPERCRRDAESAAAMGYDGKWVIHPGQVAIVNQAFNPTPERIARAQKTIVDYQRSLADGRGAATIAEEMVDAASLRVERRVLSRARAAGLIQ